MKRTPLQRRTRLGRTAPIQNRPAYRPKPCRPKPCAAQIAWKTPRYGRCENCGQIDDRPLHGHHILSRQYLARMGADEWDPANRMNLCGSCHMNHEYGLVNRKVPVDRLPAAAVAFAADLLGEDVADAYLRLHYGPPAGA